MSQTCRHMNAPSATTSAQAAAAATMMLTRPRGLERLLKHLQGSGDAAQMSVDVRDLKNEDILRLAGIIQFSV